MSDRRNRKHGRRLACFSILALAAALVLALLSLRRPYKGFSSEEVLVEVPRGASTRAIASQLSNAGVVRSSWQLLLIRILHPGAKWQAGEYRFAGRASSLTVFDRLTRGDIFYYEMTLPEGSNIFDISALLGQQGIISAENFLTAAADPSLIRDLDPQAPSLEGYLFPSTYRLTRHTTARQFCRTMTSQFRKQWHSLSADRASVHSVVTLASLIEKETAAPEERPLVASVFHNRLIKGMTLDCDPTTIYAAILEKRFRGTIHRSDLASENAYNTYRHEGLPPGPIANPGLASLKAAVAPAKTDYLYFVAEADGSKHQFTRSLAEHNRNVEEYRRGVKARSEGPSSSRVSSGHSAQSGR